MLFVICAAVLSVAHAQVCKNLKFVVKPSTGFDKQYCIEAETEYDEATISSGAYVALKNKGSFPYNFEAGLQVGAKDSTNDFRITVVIGSDLTNDDTDGICLNPYVALKTPAQNLGSRTIAQAKSTGRMNLFGEKGIFGGKPLCAPQGSVEWCLQDVDSPDLKFVPKALGIMGASVCLSFESVVIDGTGGAFRLQLGLDLLHEALFRAAVKEDCSKSTKGVCGLWMLAGAKDVEEATDKIVDLWVKLRNEAFDEDHIEFSKTINLGKMIKKLVDKQTEGEDAEANNQRRRLSDNDIKEDGALCFGDCENYERVVSTAVPVVVASALAWVVTILAL